MLVSALILITYWLIICLSLFSFHHAVAVLIPCLYSNK